MSASDLPFKPGDVLDGKYSVESVLGVGGMGAVVLAKHLSLGERVAIKCMLPELLAHPDLIGRFRREARIAVRLKSEHVVRVRDLGALPNGAPYMVMERLTGEDLGATLDRGPLPVRTAARYLIEACDAIAEAHAHGLVHRDLKPANLFLAVRPKGDPIVKVLDFGVAKQHDGGHDIVKTQTAAVIGSPQYMSPEQMRASKHVDARSDIWSLGVTLYELLTCALPFDGETAPELFASVLKDPPRPLPREVRGEVVPRALVDVVDRALQKDPADRFQTVIELARAIGDATGPELAERAYAIPEHYPGNSWSDPPESLPDEAHVASTTAGPGRRVLSTDAVAATAIAGYPLSEQPAPPEAPSRVRAVLLGAAVALVAVAGVGAALGFSSKVRDQGSAVPPSATPPAPSSTLVSPSTGLAELPSSVPVVEPTASPSSAPSGAKKVSGEPSGKSAGQVPGGRGHGGTSAGATASAAPSAPPATVAPPPPPPPTAPPPPPPTATTKVDPGARM